MSYEEIQKANPIERLNGKGRENSKGSIVQIMRKLNI